MESFYLEKQKRWISLRVTIKCHIILKEAVRGTALGALRQDGLVNASPRWKDFLLLEMSHKAIFFRKRLVTVRLLSRIFILQFLPAGDRQLTKFNPFSCSTFSFLLLDNSSSSSLRL